jgi:hypothetical protein
MSGNRKGGQHKLVITKKSLQYPVDPGIPGNVKIEKESDVAAETPLPLQPIQLKLGLRIKQAQTVELFEVRFKPGPDGMLPLHVQPADDPIAQDLTATLRIPGCGHGPIHVRSRHVGVLRGIGKEESMRIGLLGLLVIVLLVAVVAQNVYIGGLGGLVLLIVLVLFLMGRL